MAYPSFFSVGSLVQISLLVVTLLSLAIALHILFTGRNRKTSLIFFGMMISCICWNITLYLSLPIYPHYSVESLTFFARLSYGFTIIENFFLIYFCSEVLFRLRQITLFGKTFQISPLLKGFFALESVVATVLCMATPLIYNSITVDSAGRVTDIFGDFYIWYLLHIAVCTISSIFILYAKYHSAVGLLRKKLQILFLTLITSHFLAQFFNIVLPIFGNTDFYLWGGASYTLFFFGVIFITAKYRFLGSTLMFWKSLHIFLQLSVVGIFCVITYFIMMQSSLIQPYVPVVLAIVSVLSYVLTTSVFLPTFYLGKNYSSFEKAVNDTISYIKSIHNVKELEQYMSNNFANNLAIEKVEIYVIENTLDYINIAQYPENELTLYLQDTKTEIVTDEWQFGEFSLTKRQLKVLVHLTILDCSFCIPLFFQGKLVGMLILGRKSSREPYYASEVRLFSYLADYISSYLVNKSLFQKEQLTNVELNKTKELASTNATARRLMHDMKNSIQSAYAIIREIKSKKDLNKVGKVEEKLWDLEDSLNSKDSELQLTDVDIFEFLKYIVESFKELFKEKSIAYTYAIDIPEKTFIQCDRKKYKSIFENLLYNASKFTPKNGKVIFRALLNRQNSELLITISNTGSGIPESLKEKVFEPGFTTDSEKGSGLGLSIVKKFITLHGGEIYEFGTEDVDTVFTIKLPIVAPEIVVFDRKK